MMGEAVVQTPTAEEVVSEVFRQLNLEKIEDAAACFADEFKYKDHGIKLEFTVKNRLTEFFRKTRELYPDYFLRIDQKFVSGEDVITQWTLQVTITEPFYAGLTRRVPISISGVSIARITDRKITYWEDYYDGLTSRRTALAEQFTEWIEY